MKEIHAIPHNGFTAASTFSGGGGSSTGYRLAGFRIVYANEFVASAQQTYRRNHPSTLVDPRDIRCVQAEDIFRATGLGLGELDLLDGSPPCAAFSTAGKRERGWGKVKRYSDTEQRVDDLFFEFARLVRGVQPKTFVAENVSGLVKGTAKGYFKAILQTLRDCGYKVEARLLNASWLGVPQSRERVIFVGVRNDLKAIPSFPKPLGYRYNIFDVFSDLPDGEKHYITPGTMTEYMYERTPRGYSFSYACKHILGRGAMWHSHQRLSWYKPAPTILQAKPQVYHPDEKRTLTIPELKRVCSFPDDYELTGSYGQQWERCGRSVPPVMMYHIASTVRDEVLSNQ